MSAHWIHYTYVYRRNLWLKHLVSNTVWAKRNDVRKLHYVERIDHVNDKMVKACIHVTQYINLNSYYIKSYLAQIEAGIHLIYNIHKKNIFFYSYECKSFMITVIDHSFDIFGPVLRHTNTDKHT